MHKLLSNQSIHPNVQIRDTVGSENLEVYHTVLGLLRQCSEEGDPVKLFHELKGVLGQKWPHLIDEFVPFLQPDQVKSVIHSAA